jgi:hypothetical protein
MTDGQDDNDDASCSIHQKQSAGKTPAVDAPESDKPMNKCNGRNTACANDNYVDGI